MVLLNFVFLIALIVITMKIAAFVQIMMCAILTVMIQCVVILINLFGGRSPDHYQRFGANLKGSVKLRGVLLC